jgi:formamidopyrimidine-DNA glycosylase
MDQGVVAGLGNIYVDEALFDAQLSPRAQAGDLSDAELQRLAASIRVILQRAIEAGGSTVRDYVGASGQPGGFQTSHQVYNRGGKACTRCEHVLTSARIQGRTTVWCERCQGLGSGV